MAKSHAESSQFLTLRHRLNGIQSRRLCHYLSVGLSHSLPHLLMLSVVNVCAVTPSQQAHTQWRI